MELFFKNFTLCLFKYADDYKRLFSSAIFYVLKNTTVLFLLCAVSELSAKVSIVYTSNQPDILLKKNVAHFPQLSSLLNQLRAGNENNILFFHGGDSFSPSAISLFDNANNIVALANIMDVSVYSVGKRELSYDVDVLSLRSLDAQFPIISSNVLDKRSGVGVEGLFSDYRFEVEGVSVAVASLANPRALITYAPQWAEISAMSDVLPSIQENQKDADFKILMTDLKRQVSLDIAKSYDFDLILIANDGPDEIIQAGDTTVIFAGGQDGDTVVIDYDRHKTPKVSARVEQLSKFAADPIILEFVDRYHMRLDNLYNEVIAVSASDFSTDKNKIRTTETALANIFADALRDHAKTDIAVINSGSIRNSAFYPKGYAFTRGDIQQEFAFGGYFVVIEISGADLLDMMENSVSRISYIDGRFMNVSGMSMIYDSNLPVGARVKSLTVGGTDVIAEHVYKMAMQDFYLKGADDYLMLKNKEPINNLFAKRRIWHIVTDYLSQLETVKAPVLNRLINQGTDEN